MTQRNSPALDGLTAAGLLLLVLAGMLTFVVVPFLWLGRSSEEIGANRDLLRGLEARLAKQSHTVGPATEPASLMLEGDTADIAGARLQKLIDDRVTNAGGTASAYQIAAKPADGDAKRLTLNLSLSIDIDGLRDLLHSIEAGAPLVFVDGIAIRTPAAATPDADPYFLGPFEVSLQVSGFFSPGGER